MPAELGNEVWRLDTPPAVAAGAVAAITDGDLADCVVLFKLTPRRDKVSVHITRDGETVPKLGLVMPAGTELVLRRLLQRTLQEAAEIAAGEKYAV